MTIHKSKGLEFPIVIYPYADLDIYKEIEPKEWFPIKDEKISNFSHLLMNFNKDVEHYNSDCKSIFDHHKSKQEIDNINLLYVTLTRAENELYIIGSQCFNKNGQENLNLYSGLLINIGSEEMVTINELIRIAAKVADKEININHIDGPLGVRGRNSQNDTIREKLKWDYQYSLEEGMSLTYNWISDQVYQSQLDEKQILHEQVLEVV